MTSISEFIKELPNFTGIFILMLSTFLIGYFAASWFQKNKFKKIIARLKKEVNRLNTPTPKSEPADIDSIFSEIKPRIIEVVKQTHEEIAEEELEEVEDKMFEEEVVLEEKEIPKPQEEEKSEEIEEVSQQEAIAQRARTTYVNYSIDKPELDFDSFGYADHDQKDDLTKIMGIGPYIEQKLNEIGICNYSQISKLNDSDIRVITELIDFFPGRIERDNWVGQAKALSKVY